MAAAVTLSFLLVFAGSFLFLYVNVSDSLKERTDAEKIQTFKQLEHNINTFGREVELLTERLIHETVLTDLVFIGGEKESTVIQMKADYFRKLDSILGQYSYVESLCFYNSEGLSLIMDGKRNIIQNPESGEGSFFRDQLIEESDISGKSIQWYGGYTSEDFYKTSKEEEPVSLLTACRPVYWNSHRAWIVVNVNLDYFTGIYNIATADNSQETTYILDQEGKIISCSDSNILGESREEYLREHRDGAYTFEKEKWQILCYPLALGGWTMVNEMPLSVILEDVRVVRQIFIVTAIVGTMLAVFFSVLWIKRITRPLMDTTEALKCMEDGMLGITLPESEKNQDEIGILVRQFNQMSRRIERLVSENAQMEEHKREMEMKMLKFQLNPHFLYNTLNTVKWMAAMNGEEDIVDCLSALGDLLRPMYRDASPFWSLEEEESYISSYGKIMNYRYGERVHLRMDIKGEPQEAVVCKFVLQPIVENAFLYGLPQDGRQMEVRISGRKEEETLILMVADDGEGMEAVELERLRKDICEGRETKHIGLVNVNQRIQLLYGKAFGLDIVGEKGKGFTVTIRLPFQKE